MKACLLLAAALASAASLSAQTPSNPMHLLCQGWSNPWAYPGSSDCMWSYNDDGRFVREAALGGMARLEIDTLAAQKASSSAIRRVAQVFADQDSDLNRLLRAAAQKGSVAWPQAVDTKLEAEIQRLSNLSGPQFDRAFLKFEIRSGRRDLGRYRTEAEAGGNATVKSFASQTVPTLKEQIRSLKTLRRSREI